MATTTNNGWVTPDNTAYVKDGAAAIRSIGQSIDTSVGTGLLDWVSFTPTFSNFTLGNGTVSFASCKIGKTVHVRYSVTLGSTSSMGSSPSFNLPHTQNGMPTTLYTALFLDSGTAFVQAGTFLAGSTASFYYVRSDLAYPFLGSVTPTLPFTWAVNDFITGQFTYQAA